MGIEEFPNVEIEFVNNRLNILYQVELYSYIEIDFKLLFICMKGCQEAILEIFGYSESNPVPKIMLRMFLQYSDK